MDKTILRNTFLSVFIYGILSTTVIAQTSKLDFETYTTDTKQLFNQAGDWKLKDWAVFMSISAATYGILNIDSSIKNEFTFPGRKDNNILMNFGKIYGEPLTPLLLGSFFLIYGNSSGNYKNKKIGFEILQSASYTMVFTGLFKFSFGRSRPYFSNDPFEFNPFGGFKDEKLSFFSGHTGLAFSISSVLAGNTDSVILKAAFYIPAILTGISRMYTNDHWASDVFFGAAAGIFFGNFSVNQHGKSLQQLNTGSSQVKLINFSIPF